MDYRKWPSSSKWRW